MKKEICSKCRGKGYSTELRGTTAAPDFIGDKRHDTSLKVELNFCDCQRGQDIKKFIDQARKEGERDGPKKARAIVAEGLKEGHGGGNWQRLAFQVLTEIDNRINQCPRN